MRCLAKCLVFLFGFVGVIMLVCELLDCGLHVFWAVIFMDFVAVLIVLFGFTMLRGCCVYCGWLVSLLVFSSLFDFFRLVGWWCFVVFVFWLNVLVTCLFALLVAVYFGFLVWILILWGFVCFLMLIDVDLLWSL